MPKSTNSGLFGLLGRFRLHPSNADLIAYRDRELPPGTRAATRRHLEACERCRKEVALIEEGLLRFDQLARRIDPDTDALVEASLLELQQAMERHDAEVQRTPVTSLEARPTSEILASVRKELAIYLGARGAQQFLEKAQSTSFVAQDLANLVEPLMGGLLGNKGGSAVAGRVALLCKTASVPARRSVT